MADLDTREGTLADGRLFTRSWPAPTPRADVVIVHGYAEHSGRYAHVAQALVDAGCSVWALDHRGHGRSEGERGDIVSWEAAVADVDLLVDEAAAAGGGSRPIFMFGHSLGGAIALAYAEAHQDRLAGLSVSAPFIVMPPELLALADLPEIPPLPLADGISSDPAVVQAYKDDPLVYQGPPPRNILKVVGDPDGLIAGLPELTLPVQIMQGSADPLVPSQALKTVVSGVASTDLTAHLWPGLFHEIVNEPIQAAVIAELTGWVTGRLSA